VSNTGDIRVFKIVSESGVSSGVRRIEGITGERAIQRLLSRDEELATLEESLKVGEGKALERVQKLSETIKKLEKDLKTSLTKSSAINIDDMVSQAKKVKNVLLVSQNLDVSDREVLSQISDKVKDKLKSGVVILIGTPSEDSPSSPIVVSVTKDLVGQFHAGQILKQVAAVMDGKGGGRPDFAQGAGPNADKAQEAINRSAEFV